MRHGFIFIAAAAAIALATATSAGVGGASATVIAPNTAFAGHSAHKLSSDISEVLTFTESDYNGSLDDYKCTDNASYKPQSGIPVASVENNCEYHIYLQYADGVPSPFCIDAHSDRSNIGSQYQFPVRIKIGPGLGAC